MIVKVEIFVNLFIYLLSPSKMFFLLFTLLVCPKLALCQSEIVTHSVQDKPTCPLCLFAVEELVSELKDNKTVNAAEEALNNLCNDQPESLRGECSAFVENYYRVLVEMLLADLTPEQVCTNLNLWDPSVGALEVKISCSEIPQVDHMPATTKVGSTDSSFCVLCKTILSNIDDGIQVRRTEEYIKELVYNACGSVPNTVVEECNAFLDEFADLIIELVVDNLDPKLVCAKIGVCQ